MLYLCFICALFGNQLQRHEVAARRALIDDVRTVVLLLWPQGSVRVFGSFNANLSTFLSDVDLSITTKPSAAQPPQQRKANDQSGKEEEAAAASRTVASGDDEAAVLTWFTDRGSAPQTSEAETKIDESGASGSEDEEDDDEAEATAEAEEENDDDDDLEINVKGAPVSRKTLTRQQQLQAAEEVMKVVEKRSALEQLARALRKCASTFWSVEFRR